MDSDHCHCPAIDATKTLAELAGVDWGPPPNDPHVSVQERYATRAKRLCDWSHREVIRFICMGQNEAILVPVAIARLQSNPLAAGGSRKGELLSAVLEAEGFDWRGHPDSVRYVRELCQRALSELREDESVESMCAKLRLYRSLSIFERRLSAIPQRPTPG